MLIDKINAAAGSISRKTKLQTQKLSNEKFVSLLAAIALSGNKLESCLEIIDVMRGNHISDKNPISEEQKERLIEVINECGRHISDFSLDDTVVLALKTQTELIKKLLSEHWKSAAEAYSSEVVSYLTVLSDLTSNPKKANELLADIIKAQSMNDIPGKSAISKFVVNVGTAESIVGQYKLEPSIHIFLSKVMNKSATIEDLTPDVTDWLKQNNLTRKLIITL